MTSPRLWITVLALVSFLAGSAAGRILTERSTARDADRGAFADYEELLSAEFQLSPERRRLLKVLLEHYDQEKTRISNEHLSTYQSAIAPDLERLGVEYGQYIRDKVLPPEQRPDFDALARGLPD